MNVQNEYPEKVAAIASEIKIDRRSNLSGEEFKEKYLFPRKPVIITDATASWKASSWTPQWFKERYPDKMLKTDQGVMRMDDFIDAITRDSDQPGPFLREQPLKDVFSRPGRSCFPQHRLTYYRTGLVEIILLAR